MAKPSNDDGQFFMVFVGGKQDTHPKSDQCDVWFMGVVAIAIVMMVFVGLLNDAERKRVSNPPFRSESCWVQRGGTWTNRCESLL